ncbi:DEAD/DEAH box helicase [Rhizobium leguminosarum]|uniref:DEAD/DEAH box helicase n=1 Tax=Rhizobium leguminosarum TaxID=384 RepID=UPI00144235DE|nr:DEAD/DEAH box helicase [Rhizobium leguminosarum]MBY5801153.1 DEAD/DEAH box helicase [Rhizobium leguminosarum]NKL96353.1 DEAD/DEAH box helicase [Rhizobium leguminosarum bv. viciae]
MTFEAVNWVEVGRNSGDDLKRSVFRLLRNASAAINGDDPHDPKLLEVVPRLADLIATKPELKSFKEAYSALARATGLWNYIDKSSADTADAIVAEAVTADELGVTFHREQIAVLNDLLAGRNVILSAPTSFGKSLLIDALLATGKYERIAIVLPTIALLDEFRRRLRRRFRDRFDVIMHPGDVVGDGPTIFLGTQERLLNRDDLGSLDLTVVDEFYKLDADRKDERSASLNAAVYRLLARSRQFFFLGPNIDTVRVSGGGRWQFNFIKTRFATVAVDTFDLRAIPDKRERLLEEIGKEENWPALVFVSSPDKANTLASEAAKEMAVTESRGEFSDWLGENVGSRWSVVRSVRFGFAVHHGRIPRAIASHMVRLFNTGHLPVLFCTSTLIEGVNTAAKTVLIYDKQIKRADYDFFTFSNIKGRAGRLGEHHVGRVFLFNEPPEQVEMQVSPTVFSDDDDAPDDYVVFLEDEDKSDVVEDRISELRRSLDLDPAGLRLAASIGLDVVAEIKRTVENRLRFSTQLVFRGQPDYDTIRVLVNVVTQVKKVGEYGAKSEAQLVLRISRLRRARTIKEFLREHDDNLQEKELDFDLVFKFLRACEYGLPQIFSIIEIYVKRKHPEADYHLFLRSLARWFRAEELKNLDEEGVPIQITERFHRNGDTYSSLVERLSTAVTSRSPQLSEFERAWVANALDIPLG